MALVPRGPWLESFLEMMAVERGAARHTLDAYQRDLADYVRFLAGRRLAVETADAAAVRAYLSALSKRGLATATVARAGGESPGKWRAYTAFTAAKSDMFLR